MKRGFTLFFCLQFIYVLVSGQNCVNSGDAFTGVSGWGACTNMSNSAGNTEIFTTNVTTTGNRYFRFYGDGTPCGEYGPNGGVDIQMTIGVIQSLTCGSAKAYYINGTNTSFNYVIKAGGTGASNSNEGKAVVFEIQGTVRAISSQSRNPSGTINGGQSVDITANLDGSLSTGQAIYLRYTTNGFSTSTVVKMSGSGTTYTATIPGVGTNTTVTYYLFTSGDVASISASDADLYTINLLNNGGSNYSYTTSAVLESSLLDVLTERIGSSNKLHWATSSEKNAAQFNIQRSANNSAWQTIGSVKATNSATGAKYNFVDDTPLSTVNYYRLQMVDNDGKTTYSKVVSVSNKDKETLSVYPNPVKSELNLVTDDNTEGGMIFDMTGKVVSQLPSRTTRVNVENLTSGVYFIRLLDKNGVLSLPVRFVKQ